MAWERWIRCRVWTGFSSLELKAQINFSSRLSVVCLFVCPYVNFPHFHLLLQNHWANSNQNIAWSILGCRALNFLRIKGPFNSEKGECFPPLNQHFGYNHSFVQICSLIRTVSKWRDVAHGSLVCLGHVFHTLCLGPFRQRSVKLSELSRISPLYIFNWLTRATRNTNYQSIVWGHQVYDGWGPRCLFLMDILSKFSIKIWAMIKSEWKIGTHTT